MNKRKNERVFSAHFGPFLAEREVLPKRNLTDTFSLEMLFEVDPYVFKTIVHCKSNYKRRNTFNYP